MWKRFYNDAVYFIVPDIFNNIKTVKSLVKYLVKTSQEIVRINKIKNKKIVKL